MRLTIENHGTLNINVLDGDDDLIGDEWEEDDPDPGDEEDFEVPPPALELVARGA